MVHGFERDDSVSPVSRQCRGAAACRSQGISACAVGHVEPQAVRAARTTVPRLVEEMRRRSGRSSPEAAARPRERWPLEGRV